VPISGESTAEENVWDLRTRRLTSIPTVFPSTYRDDTANQATDIKVDERINVSTTQRTGREGREARYESYRRGPREERRFEEDVKVYEEDRREPRDSRVEIERER